MMCFGFVRMYLDIRKRAVLCVTAESCWGGPKGKGIQNTLVTFCPSHRLRDEVLTDAAWWTLKIFIFHSPTGVCIASAIRTS